jgi:spore germination protein
MPRARRGLAATVAVALAALAMAGGAAIVLRRLPGLGAAATTTTSLYARTVAVAERAALLAESAIAVPLPRRESAAAPAPPAGARLFRRALPPHAVLGFLPYWSLGDAASFPATDLSAVAYYAVGIEPDGSLSATSPGYAALSGASFATLVSRAHAAGDAVLLTVFSEDQAVIQALCAHPVPAGTELARSLAAVLRARHLDGVDVDIEGQETGDRAGFVRLVVALRSALAVVDPSASLVVDTYPSSASDPAGFFDVRALAHSADALYVMGYDMEDPEVASPDAALGGSGASDAYALASYVQTVPASKILLGIPFYGYDFATTSPRPFADALGPPVARTFASIAAAGYRPLWDPGSETPFAVYRSPAGTWHEVWYDDTVSVALKVALAQAFRCRGVGVWAIGMAGGDAALYRALLGGSAPLRPAFSTR